MMLEMFPVHGKIRFVIPVFTSVTFNIIIWSDCIILTASPSYTPIDVKLFISFS